MVGLTTAFLWYNKSQVILKIYLVAREGQQNTVL